MSARRGLARAGRRRDGSRRESGVFAARPPGGAVVRMPGGYLWELARASRRLAGAAAAAACLATGASAIDPAAGTGGSAFMKLGHGNPRAQALGRAYVALAEGQDAMTWNPAGVARIGTRELVFSMLDHVEDYGGQYVGYVHPLGRTVIGLNLAHMTAGEFDVRDANGLPLDQSTTQARTGFATLAFSRSFFLERLFLGVSAKGLYEDNAGTRRNSFAGDVGALIRPNPRISFGGALQNILNREDRVVQTRRVGAAFSPTDFLTLSVEASKDSDNESRFGAGAEIVLPQELLQVGEFNFRVGYYTRDNLGQGFAESLKRFGVDLSRSSGLSYGFGVYTNQLMGYGLGVDYAYVPFGALGGVNQIGVRFSF